MNNIHIAIISIILLSCIYLIYNKNDKYAIDDLEHFWGWNPFRKAKRFTKKTFRTIGRGAKKVYSTGKKGVKKAGSGIKKLANSVKNLKQTLKGVTNKIKAIGSVFGSLFNVIDDGFGLLKKSVEMLIVIAQILFLIVDKMRKCSKGLTDTTLVLKKQIDQIYKELLDIKNKMSECMSLKHVYTNNYYNKCISSMFKYRISIKDYIKRLTGIMNNPSLFAQINSSKYGASKQYCNSKFKTREGKKFRYSRRCNQCFNLKGLMAKGHSQLLNVTDLIDKSDELFNEIGKLKRNLDRVF